VQVTFTSRYRKIRTQSLSKPRIVLGQTPTDARNFWGFVGQTTQKKESEADRQTSQGFEFSFVFDRTILITGATGGVGLEAARVLRARGAEVIIGSRDHGRYSQTATLLGEEGVHSFIADLTDPQQVAHGLELIQRNGFEPTDVVHAAAGGLEPILRDMVRLLTGLKKVHGVERDQAHAAAMVELAPIVKATREMAMTVNFTAPSELLDILVPRLPPGGSVTFYNEHLVELLSPPSGSDLLPEHRGVQGARWSFGWRTEQIGGRRGTSHRTHQLDLDP